jgi:putative ABC transport system ATP-binding protein
VSPGAAIEAHGLVKRYPVGDAAYTALAGVSLVVEPGEFVVLSGPSGSGKSTLLSLIGLLERADAGILRIDGRDVGLDDEADARLRGGRIGFVFQAFNLVPQLTIEQNVALPLQLHGALRTRDAVARAREALDGLGLLDQARKFPEQLSGGQQQRAAVARALVGRPGLLLADEPTGNLDSASGTRVLALLREAQAAGTTVVMVTHDLRHVAPGDRVVTLHDGRRVDVA